MSRLARLFRPRSNHNLLNERPRLVAVPKGSLIRAAARRMRIRTRPQVKAIRVKGQAKCGICLGVIKKDLPSVTCSCENQYHNSCAIRTGTCPVCEAVLRCTRQKPHVVDSDMPPVRPARLSKRDRLFLLDERFLLGEITERTYLSVRDEVSKAAEDAVFCDACGRRLLDNETCDCMLYERELQCPECGSRLSDEDQFCRRCGVVFSADFSKELFQCPDCGQIVSDDEGLCGCGVLLVGEGNMICPECGAEIPQAALECSVCSHAFVQEISECPACGRRVDKDAFSCECGVIFSDRVGGVECSECGADVSLADRFCPECGARFADELWLEGKVERSVRS
ncbi:MAG: zinc ribbon domain-containing protein [Thermoplasmata archaeon]|nr:zinc ribbon domain-containing protein [Thermoplasmata archaeon]